MRALWAAAATSLVGLSCSGTNPNVTCTAPQQACGTGCADLRSDNQHCGSCGNACGADNACASSRCWPRACGTLTCADSQACVDSVCADRTCFGVMCPTSETCAGGACYPKGCGASPCPSGEVCVNNACADAACVGVLCPAGLACARGACVADSCGDGVKSGAETDSDCGGPLCTPCATGQKCTAALDCASKSCTQGTCALPTCNDGARNGQEGDVDCGGTCASCAEGRTCTIGPQCQSLTCSNGRCALPACADMVKNGNETDRDCGGTCPACADGLTCAAPGDCMSARCVSSRCVSAACVNGVKDGAESDVDCGEVCAPCPDGRQCTKPADCASMVCGAAMRCVLATCSDGVKNGLESDVDCAGACAACGVGRACRVAADCLHKVCGNNLCFAPSCSDNVTNGPESDVDCGGDAGCPGCGTGKRCLGNADCAGGLCAGMACGPTQLLFAPVAPLNGGINPRGLTAIDIDGDGLTDLAAANYGSSDLSLWFQELDGGLAPAIRLGVTTNSSIYGPVSIAIDDLEGDGFRDLVVPRNMYRDVFFGGPGGCRISILKGLGSRQFLAAADVEYFDPATPWQSGCGYQSKLVRLDADARLDLVASDGIDNFGGGGPAGDTKGGLAFARIADGGFDMTPELLPQAGPFIQVVDVNNDGKADVVGHTGRLGEVRTFLGNGDGTFQAPLAFGVAAGAGDVVAADFTGDATLDLAIASETTNLVGVCKGLGNGMFLAPVTLPVPTPVAVRAGDIDRDGKLDLVVGTTGVAVAIGQGDGGFAPPDTFHPSLGRVRQLAIGDFNGDNKPDVAVIANSQVQVLYNRTP